MPAVVVDVVRLGRMTALQKPPDGGVRGIVVGDVSRRLVVRTVTQQLMPAFERYTAPFQHALKTRGVWFTCCKLSQKRIPMPHCFVN